MGLDKQVRDASLPLGCGNRDNRLYPGSTRPDVQPNLDPERRRDRGLGQRFVQHNIQRLQHINRLNAGRLLHAASPLLFPASISIVTRPGEDSCVSSKNLARGPTFESPK